MKKLSLTLLATMFISGAAFAQGYIQWVLPSIDVSFQTNTAASPLFGGSGSGGQTGATANVAGGFDYILLTQTYTGSAPTDGNVWDGTWSALTGFTSGSTLIATNGTGPSGFGKANATPGADNGQQVSWANGTTQSVVVVGWSTDIGSSWLGVSNILVQLALGNSAPLLAADGGANAYFGETAYGWINPNAAAPGAALAAGAGPQAYGEALFSLNTSLYELNPIPEPTTIALAGLGGLSLLLFRRRKV